MQSAAPRTPQQKNSDLQKTVIAELVSKVELDTGAAAFGAPSDSPEWMYECEVRMLATAEFEMVSNFYRGVASKRGEHVMEKLKAAVTERKAAMLKLGLTHPRINMKRYMEDTIKQDEPSSPPQKRRGLF